ncbi:MAG: penicillin-binding protein 1C [Saprospiraceae bacterium]
MGRIRALDTLAQAVRRRPRTFAVSALLLLLWVFCLPRPLFRTPYSLVLEDESGELLGARIAADGQWRFPPTDSLPEKYAVALVAYEDRRFWRHPGIDPVGLARALLRNISAGSNLQGGSTLSMQVIRLARNKQRRSLWNKTLEMFMATRLELAYSKREILRLYASQAPFGGNIVGVESACWRYFSKTPSRITWAEAALLAVLPKNPAQIHPGRNRDALLARRNRLLARLRDIGKITSLDCELAQAEPLPDRPHPLPDLAPHFLDRCAGGVFSPKKRGDSSRYRSTLQRELQIRLNEVIDRYQQRYADRGVEHLAAVILDVSSGAVIAYAGNAPGARHRQSTDIVVAPRSTGSILKPYLYAFAMQAGEILPDALLEDIPTQWGRYRPDNYLNAYDGVVGARRALVRSLNVPFVSLLQRHGVGRFHHELQQLGLSTLVRAPEHYGLSLILGGAEARLLDVTNAYACMSRTLGAFGRRSGRYAADDFRPPFFFAADTARRETRVLEQPPLLSAGVIWHTFQAMREVERPDESGQWEVFASSRLVAWKTGTSIGFRDAWAVGVTPRYAVGVWVGNADGEGRPGLIGVRMAAPALFSVFELLPPDEWFDPPYDDLRRATLCRYSGCLAGAYCRPDSAWIPKAGLQAPACSYCRPIHLSPDGKWQANSRCESPERMQHRNQFVLPPVQAHYFALRNPWYVPPPPFRPDCADFADRQTLMQFVYPRGASSVYIPVELDGEEGKVVFKVAHSLPSAQLFWHLDGIWCGTTRHFHEMALQPEPGKHTLAVIDESGARIEQRFEVKSRANAAQAR